MKKSLSIGFITVIAMVGFLYFSKDITKDYTKNKIDADEIVEMSKKDDKLYVLIGNRSCASCNEYKPILQKAINETKTEVYYMDTNNSKNGSFLKEHNITATPTILVIKQDKISRIEGSISLKDTKTLLNGGVS
ncbi:thioredoxin family protein [Enterococcus plantarum]|uniref:thioredoxin family protein n=1 Tax=Enterococcus TaxID=1350 RepID=UPI001A8E04AA|nr:thioredoxin family protein [Enterococcus plantarum]MBO0421357.1 thioredoxin family protein [Enterococcus plantarum]